MVLNLVYHLVILIFIKLVTSQDTNYFDRISQSDQLRQFYFPFYNQTIELINFVLSDEKSLIDSKCGNSLIQLRNGLINFDEWALKCKF